MSCCEAIVQPFANETAVSIPYGEIQRTAYGNTPNVQVWIEDGEEYVLSDDGNQIRIEEGSIEIDLGGPGAGFVKVF